jgi:outer membrane autotransporter protein
MMISGCEIIKNYKLKFTMKKLYLTNCLFTIGILLFAKQVNAIELSNLHKTNILPTGIAAGEDRFKPIGIWIKSFNSSGELKSSQTLPSFKLEHNATILGIDSMVNEINLIGLAFSRSNIRTYINDSYSSNVDMLGNVLVAYWTRIFTNGFVLNSQFKAGTLKLNNEGASTAKSKGTLWGINEELSYGARFNNGFILTPTIGFSYNETHYKKYDDKLGPNDVSVTSKLYSRLNGLLGLDIAKAIEVNKTTFTPSIYSNIKHTISVKEGSSKIISVDNSLDPMVIPNYKRHKISYVLGTKLKVACTNTAEIALDHNMLIRGKFRSQSSSINLRVNL